MRFAVALLGAVLCSQSLASPPAAQRTLTFEDRVKAQEAIERVYYSHQIGATKSFEDAVPRSVLEEKVRTYLKQSVALERIWKTPITAVSLQHEIDRIAGASQMSERLRELFSALGNDPILVAECLARPTLADRLTRNFFAFDPVIHADSRARAEQLRSQIAAGEIDILEEYPNRNVVQVEVGDPSRITDDAYSTDRSQSLPPVVLSAADFQRRREELPARCGDLSEIEAQRGSFVFRVLLSETAVAIRVATFAVPKITWGEWWSRAANSFSEGELPLISSLSTITLPGTNATSCDSAERWNPSILDDLPRPRAGHTAVWTEHEMIIWGAVGWPLKNSGSRYDPFTDTWRAISTVGAPTERYSHTALWTGSEMIVWGGYNGAESLNDGGRYDPATDSWSPMSHAGAPSRTGFGGVAVWTGTEMIVVGGRYNPATDTWAAMSMEGAPTLTYYTSGVWTGSVLVVMGGFPLSGGRYYPATDSWAPMSTAGAGYATGRAPVWTGTKVLTWSCGDGGRYDPVHDTWEPMSRSGQPYEAGCANTAVWNGKVMIVWGGLDPEYPLKNGGRYNPITDTWERTTLLGAPPGRYQHTAIWTGERMIVWGGQYAGNTGGRYDPVTDTWTPTSTVGPAVNDGPAVWTGNHMIVWGGLALWSDWYWAPGEQVGGRYDPTLDTWKQTETEDAPSPRLFHSLVWDGSKAIVWGGKDRIGQGATFLNTGGLYDPITDRWTATSTDGAPSARIFHSAVWTAGRMVVWGGGFYESDNTGGRYDPETDAWMPTSTTGAPYGYRQSAISTGTKMIVWHGGGSGERYDPASDTWMPMSTEGAPTGSGAIWAGDELFVWGHDPGTAGFYDPDADAWTPASNAGAPLYGGPAAWTGTEIIVWGGTDGGRYRPATASWVPMSTVGAPSGGTTALWTGTEMILWSSNSDSGRYVPGAPDVDGDGICDASDNCPVVANSGQADADVDGSGDACDTCTDADSDGFGTGSLSNAGCFGGTMRDCDDSRASINPGAAETCNSIDDNCDGLVDEDASGVDSDGDGIHNLCDNCGTTPNPSQADTDADGPGNACDNCPLSANSFQDDVDGDRVGDVCDNCIFDFNPAQSDFNSDGEGDICDLNDGLICVVGTDDKNYVEWQTESGYGTWNSYRGSLSVLRATGEYTQAPGSNPLAHRECGLIDPYVLDDEVPGPGEVEFNLVTGVAGGIESGLGVNSAGVPRANARPCP